MIYSGSVEVKPKKKTRRFLGIDPPYDKIVRNPERWFREKPVRRRQVLTNLHDHVHMSNARLNWLGAHYGVFNRGIKSAINVEDRDDG